MNESNKHGWLCSHQVLCTAREERFDRHWRRVPTEELTPTRFRTLFFSRWLWFFRLIAPAGGDTLGEALGATLDDHFVKTFGRLASISVVRCCVSDEGATAIARGIWASNTLTHVDLSGLKIFTLRRRRLLLTAIYYCGTFCRGVQDGFRAHPCLTRRVFSTYDALGLPYQGWVEYAHRNRFFFINFMS